MNLLNPIHGSCVVAKLDHSPLYQKHVRHVNSASLEALPVRGVPEDLIEIVHAPEGTNLLPEAGVQSHSAYCIGFSQARRHTFVRINVLPLRFASISREFLESLEVSNFLERVIACRENIP